MDVPEEEVTLLLPAGRLPLLLLPSSSQSRVGGWLVCMGKYEFIDFRAKNHVINLISSSPVPSHPQSPPPVLAAAAALYCVHPVELLLL